MTDHLATPIFQGEQQGAKQRPPEGLSVSPERDELTITWTGDDVSALTAEQLRVWSPSAEVQGHGPGQAVLQTGKRSVKITDIQAVGRYAVRIVFDDGHNTGIYSWSFLRETSAHKDEMWADYLAALEDAGEGR
ncbi:MAG: DUF971 domain-containing protein [Pseudomonadota bacterium]